MSSRRGTKTAKSAAPSSHQTTQDIQLISGSNSGGGVPSGPDTSPTGSNSAVSSSSMWALSSRVGGSRGSSATTTSSAMSSAAPNKGSTTLSKEHLSFLKERERLKDIISGVTPFGTTATVGHLTPAADLKEREEANVSGAYMDKPDLPDHGDDASHEEDINWKSDTYSHPLPVSEYGSGKASGAGGVNQASRDVLSKKGILITRSTFNTEDLFVDRTTEARTISPERINIDQQGLESFPIIRGETTLRLLNLENNRIRSIANLQSLPNLIFLDLYNNGIEEISGLECVPSLRVLMLGKNNIKYDSCVAVLLFCCVVCCIAVVLFVAFVFFQSGLAQACTLSHISFLLSSSLDINCRRISKLECVTQLDVLDLHSNDISVLEGVSHLSVLRVLNLAGNRISVVENISDLSNLNELNLRRNQVRGY